MCNTQQELLKSAPQQCMSLIDEFWAEMCQFKTPFMQVQAKRTKYYASADVRFLPTNAEALHVSHDMSHVMLESVCGKLSRNQTK
jgi:hypothetical protein